MNFRQKTLHRLRDFLIYCVIFWKKTRVHRAPLANIHKAVVKCAWILAYRLAWEAFWCIESFNPYIFGQAMRQNISSHFQICELLSLRDLPLQGFPNKALFPDWYVLKVDFWRKPRLVECIGGCAIKPFPKLNFLSLRDQKRLGCAPPWAWSDSYILMLPFFLTLSLLPCRFGRVGSTSPLPLRRCPPASAARPSPPRTTSLSSSLPNVPHSTGSAAGFV